MKKFTLGLIASLFVFFFTTTQAFAASSISIDTDIPESCQLISSQINITGTAIAEAPPGNLNQYGVDVNWGDGTVNNVIAKGSFGGNVKGTNTLSYSDIHTYSVPGSYTITAKIYHTKENGNDNQDDEIATKTVCIVSPLTISKTAFTSFDRTWAWNIDKTASNTNLVLEKGLPYTVNYGITANASSVDSNWAVTGNISVTNPLHNPVITINVTDNMASEGPVTVNCPTQTINPGDTLVCTYSKSINSATNQLNTASVSVNGISVLNGTATANVDFSTANINKIDDCATVTDINLAGPQGVSVCSTNLPAVWNYSVSFGMNANTDINLVCGINTPYTNTVTLVTNTSSTTLRDSVSVNATVNCPQGCTLTQGYWKTHNGSFNGGKHIDDTWSALWIDSELHPFYTSGKNWFNTFWTSINGNAYYQLADQYMAAKLNILKGADPSAVNTAINSAELLFNNPLNTPIAIGKLKGGSSLRNQFISLAGILGSYNEGLIGPGHCSE